MLYLLTGHLPWAVTANSELWEVAHGRQPLQLWSVTSSWVGGTDLSYHWCIQLTCISACFRLHLVMAKSHWLHAVPVCLG